MVQSEFLKECGNEPAKYTNSGYNDQYNNWEEGCLKKLVSKYKSEYGHQIREWLGLNRAIPGTKTVSQSQSLNSSLIPVVTTNQKTENFTSGTATGIGLGSAAGGTVLGLFPMLIKRLFIKFS